MPSSFIPVSQEDVVPTDGAPFESILWRDVAAIPAPAPLADQVMHDLALDQVFAAIEADSPISLTALRTPLHSVKDIHYRHEIFEALTSAELRRIVDDFLRLISQRNYRGHTSTSARLPYEGQLWHLAEVESHLSALRTLQEGLARILPALSAPGAGWSSLSRYLDSLCSSPTYSELEQHTSRVRDALSSTRYNALIRSDKVSIAPRDDEANMEEHVLAVFSRFSDAAINHPPASSHDRPGHIQGWMIERAALVYPQAFDELATYCAATTEYRDPILERFIDEIHFYLSYLDYLAPIVQTGLTLCLPRISESVKTLDLTAGWDLALAARLSRDHIAAVTNNLSLVGQERILVISGPNQGGKTTTARMFGQVHHLAALGCPVPGEHAELFLCDHVLTVFDRVEDIDTLEGRLEAEVQRLRMVLDNASERSVVVINEAFSSTSLHDARILLRDILTKISRLDALAACVTFIDELSRLNDKTVSLVSNVAPENPTVRTFTVTRRFADGKVYARALAATHGLTYEQITATLADSRGKDEEQ